MSKYLRFQSFKSLLVNLTSGLSLLKPLKSRYCSRSVTISSSIIYAIQSDTKQLGPSSLLLTDVGDQMCAVNGSRHVNSATYAKKTVTNFISSPPTFRRCHQDRDSVANIQHLSATEIGLPSNGGEVVFNLLYILFLVF